MARPAKSLHEHVRDGSFRAERHAHLLAQPDLPFEYFAALQQRYRAAGTNTERHRCALEFEQAVVAAHRHAASESPAVALAAALARLGTPASAAHVKRFFAEFLTYSKGRTRGEPFRLVGFQEAFVRDLLRRDGQGKRIVRQAVLGIPRGNGKTCLAAALALYELVTRTDAPEILIGAGSKAQAKITLDFIRGLVAEGPLHNFLEFRSDGCRCQATGGEIKVLSSEGRLAYGRAPSVVILDELWAFTSRALLELYDAMVSGMHKREEPLLLAITTAGYAGDNLLHTIYQAAMSFPEVNLERDGCLTVAKDDRNGQLLHWYALPANAEPGDERLWRKANPAPWITIADLRKLRNSPGFPESEFRRLILNRWSAPTDAWIPAETWQRLETSEAIPDRAEIYVGVDVGVFHDTTAVVWAHVTPAGEILLDSCIFGPGDATDAHVHFPDQAVDLSQIEQFIRDLDRRYRIVSLSYDPRYFVRSAQELEKTGIKVVEYQPHAAPTYDAYQRFYQLVHEGKVRHNGDPILTAQITNTAAIRTDRGWKLSKLKNKKWFDATVAACLAVARADIDAHEPEPNIFFVPMAGF